VVAVLLACLRAPDAISERPALETLLAELSREQLQALLLKLAKGRPDISDLIDSQVQLLSRPTIINATATSPPRQRTTELNPEPFRRQVRSAMHTLDRMRSSEAYWHIGSVVNEVVQVAEQARPFIENGDARSALAILDSVTSAYMQEWEMLDDSDGEASGFFGELAPLWTEALLCGELTLDEREKWESELDAWQGELSDYGVDNVFEAAIAAARQGWDDPALVRVLQGELPPQRPWEHETPDDASELTEARLRVLERQGRTQEYLNLALAKNQLDSYLTMLAQLGRIGEALEFGLRHLHSSSEVLTVAQAFHARGAVAEALRLAGYGLSLPEAEPVPAYGYYLPPSHGRAQLGRWLRDQARAVGEHQQALAAAQVVQHVQPTLADYQALRELASENWPGMRDKVLAALRQAEQRHAQEAVNIYLHEGLIDDAIRVAENGSSYGDVLERVADAAISTHAVWVIERGRKQAEATIARTQAKYYPHAAQWLERVRNAYKAAGRSDEWHSYLNELLETHKRKTSLMPLLRKL
jgi:uncharacterized Zn finger protein